MKKLKDILSEGYAWERRPGKPLPTLAEVQAEYLRNEAAKAAKPDFLDLDNDGDTKEPMKSAARDMNEEDEPRWQDSDGDGKWYEPEDVNEYGDNETHSIHVSETGVEPYDAAYNKPKDAMTESFWKRVNGNLHGHEYILREAFRK